MYMFHFQIYRRDGVHVPFPEHDGSRYEHFDRGGEMFHALQDQPAAQRADVAPSAEAHALAAGVYLQPGPGQVRARLLPQARVKSYFSAMVG